MHCNMKPQHAAPVRSLAPPRAALFFLATACAIGPGIALAQTAAAPAQIERVMVTGETQTPSIDATLELIGREAVLARMDAALSAFQG